MSDSLYTSTQELFNILIFLIHEPSALIKSVHLMSVYKIHELI